MLLARPALAATWLAGELEEPGPHPRSLASPPDLELLRERVTREPYAGLLRRMAGLAARELTLGSAEIGAIESRLA